MRIAFGSRSSAPKRLLRLNEQLYSTIYEHQVKRHWQQQGAEIDPFTFMASASLRADSTCHHYPCRTSKLDFLGRYAALYANNVIVPLPLSSPDNAAKRLVDATHDLSQSIQSLLQLRPLIDAGLITPVIMKSFHCVHTYEWAHKMIEAVHRAAMGLAKDSSRLFRVVYQLPEKSPTGESTVYVEGPEDLIEHGEMVGTWVEGNRWRLKSWRFDRDGKVEIRGQKKLSRIYELAFEKIANDTSFYLAFARLHSARYLSDRSGETVLLEALVDDEDIATNNRQLHAMGHLVPLLGDLPVSTLLRIRREDRNAFARYRSALRQLLNEMVLRKRRISKREVDELFRDKIVPELLRMKSELRQERKRQTRRIAGGIASLSAGVSLGAFGAFLPMLAKAAAVGASLMVGGRLLSKAAEDVCEHGSNLAAKNDFYFLLKVAEEAGME